LSTKYYLAEADNLKYRTIDTLGYKHNSFIALTQVNSENSKMFQNKTVKQSYKITFKMDQLHTKFNNKSVNSFVSLKIIPNTLRFKIVVEVS